MQKQIAYLLTAFIFSLAASSCIAPQKENQQKENAAIENILTRKSVRSYENHPIEKEKIDWMLRAGMAAPSGMDRRPWEFIVVTDRAKLNEMAANLPYAKMLNQAPCAIVVCGDSSRSSYWYLDCSAATQNILLAAESLKLGAVWTAAYPYEDRMEVVMNTLGLPENILPLCVIPIGYPSGENAPKDKFDEKKIHYERY